MLLLNKKRGWSVPCVVFFKAHSVVFTLFFFLHRSRILRLNVDFGLHVDSYLLSPSLKLNQTPQTNHTTVNKHQYDFLKPDDISAAMEWGAVISKPLVREARESCKTCDGHLTARGDRVREDIGVHQAIAEVGSWSLCVAGRRKRGGERMSSESGGQKSHSAILTDFGQTVL